MDKPVCRVCGARHWSREPHAFASNVTAPEQAQERNVTAPDSVKRNVTPCVGCRERDAIIAELREALEQPKQRRAAYMREYRSKSRS